MATSAAAFPALTRTLSGETSQPPARSAPATAARDGQVQAAPALATLPAATTDAIKELSEALQSTSISLQFKIDEDSHKVITNVVDRDTGELIRQIPSEEMMRVARAMNKLQGLLVEQTA